MKKKVCAVILAAVLLLGIPAFAAGGTTSDPLISVSWLINTFLPRLEHTITQRAQTVTQPLWDESLDRVDTAGTKAMAASGKEGWSYTSFYQSMDVKRGDTLTLHPGSGIVWLNGRACAGAGLVSVSTAKEPAENEELIVSHRYLNGSEHPVTVTVLSDAAQLCVEGYWVLTESFESTTPFYDLTQSTDWFYAAARFSADRKLFNGTSTHTFSPQVTMNRAMLATVLYRLSSSPGVAYTGKFPDVANGEWYTAPVEWAVLAGVVKGYDDDTFRPMQTVTRETIAVMLYRYASYLGLDVSAQKDLSQFPDYRQVSSWATDAMEWAVGCGIIGGSSGYLKPAADATRAEVATMLQRMMLWAGLA